MCVVAVAIDERPHEVADVDREAGLLEEFATQTDDWVFALLEEAARRIPQTRVGLVRATREQHSTRVVDDQRGHCGSGVGVVSETTRLAPDATLVGRDRRRAARTEAPAVQSTHVGTVPRVSPRHVPASVAELARVGLFAELPGEELSKLAERMAREEVEAGTVVVREGEPGDRFYVLLTGIAGVSQTSIGGRRVLRAGDFFGEVALAMRISRTATITAMTPCVVASCDEATFDELVRPLFAED